MTNDDWNAELSQVGLIPILANPSTLEQAYATLLPEGAAVAAKLVVSKPPLQKPSLVGSFKRDITATELVLVEDDLRDFLQLTTLLQTTPKVPSKVAHAELYPQWGEIYYGPKIDEEIKRFIVVSPDSWNALSNTVVAMRTTTKKKARVHEFPFIQNGRVQACCGDASSLRRAALKVTARLADRPDPAMLVLADKVAIARGLVEVYDLHDALARAGVIVKPDGTL